MKFGLLIANSGSFGDAGLFAEMAHSAELHGWDGVFISDHVLKGAEPIIDPWIALTAAATQTSRVLLGTLVTNVVRRHPMILARQVSTLDHLSRGRLVVGVGAGDADSVETRALFEAQTASQRAEHLDETLSVIGQWWADGRVDVRGSQIAMVAEVAGSTAGRPRPPVWVAATRPTGPAVDRAASWDGIAPWTPKPMTPHDLRTIAASVTARRGGLDDFDIVYFDRADLDRSETRGDLDAIAEAGATWWVRLIRDTDTVEKAMARITGGPRR